MPKNYEKRGFVDLDEIAYNVPSQKRMEARPVAIIECVQEIPCNPCVDACPTGAISMENLNAVPLLDAEKCIGCGQCMRVCPGLCIFLVHLTGETARVTLPYEMLPLPKIGEMVRTRGRDGSILGEGKVLRVETVGEEASSLVTLEVPREMAMHVRHFEVIV